MKKRDKHDGDYLGNRYLAVLSGFVLLFLIMLMLPHFMGRNFNFPDAGLDQFQPMGGNLHIAMVRREYDPEQELMRLDFLIEDTMSATRLPNLEFEIEARYISGTRQLGLVEARVNDHFIVLYIEYLPRNFGVLSVSLTPYLLHPELHGGSNLAGSGVRMYVNETPELLHYGLVPRTIDDHRRDHIDVEERFLQTEITEKEEEIRQHDFAVSFLQDAISTLQNEMQYMTRSERETAYLTVTGHEAAIANHERNTAELRDEVAELQERIELLEQRRQSI